VIPDLRGRRTAVLGVGSELNGDDAAGLLAARYLSRRITNFQIKNRGAENKAGISVGLVQLFVYEAGRAPENFSGPIRKIEPEIILFVDAADMGLPVGAVRWVKREEITGFGGSTHLTPLVILADYFSSEMGCDCYFIGIQPESVEFDHKINLSVREAARKVAGMIFSKYLG
jgi:hydrogenase 3 maturation protease